MDSITLCKYLKVWHYLESLASQQVLAKYGITYIFGKAPKLHLSSTQSSKITTPGSCDPYGSKCRTVFVSADMPEMVKDYADIKGRYIYNQDEKVEWAPQRPVYEKVSRSRSLIYER